MGGSSSGSRRRFLQAASTITTLGIAGCVDALPFGRTEPSDFPYATGFSEEDIDIERALGPTSAMAAVDSLSLSSSRRLSFPFGKIAVDLTGQVDQTTETFLIGNRRNNSIESRFIVQDQFFDSTELFERTRVEPRALDFTYRARPYEFDVESEYRLNELQDLLTDIDLTATYVQTREQTPLAVYSATFDQVGTNSMFHDWSESIGEFQEGAVKVKADADGLFHLVDAAFSFLNQDGQEVRIETTLEYSDFGIPDVGEPDWFAEVPGRERPDVVVDFTETVGEAVEVSVVAMAHTNEVAVVIQDEGVVAHFEEPDDVSIEAERYTTDSGTATALIVFAQNDIRGPVQVGFYQPQPATT